MSSPPFAPPSLEALAQSLITGRLDHGQLPRLPSLGSRPFWVGAAIGAGLVLMLRARPSFAPSLSARDPQTPSQL